MSDFTGKVKEHFRNYIFRENIQSIKYINTIIILIYYKSNLILTKIINKKWLNKFARKELGFELYILFDQ